jgi:ribonuclease H2 subunit A
MLEGKANGVKVEWPLEDDGETSRVTDFFTTADKDNESSELGNWFGTPVGLEAF